MPHLTVLVGAPGAGKSTYAKNMRAHVVSTDGFREGTIDNYGHAIARAYKEINRKLAAGEDVVFDSPASNPAVRKAALGIARKHGATTSATVLLTPLADCMKAQDARGKAAVPYEDVARLHRTIGGQIPGLAKEGFDAVVIVDRRPGATGYRRS